MKILQVISSLNPAYGGVAACLEALTPELAALGHVSEAVTLDAPDAPFLRTFPGTVHAVGPAKSSYQYSPRLVPWLRAEMKRFDVAVVHGMWQYHGCAVHRALRGIIPATIGLGMLTAFRMGKPLLNDSAREGRISVLVSLAILAACAGGIAWHRAPVFVLLPGAGLLSALHAWLNHSPSLVVEES